MSIIRFKIALILAVMAGTLPAASQLRPSSADQYPPNPPANHVEVRFAIGKQAVTCKRFDLTVKAGEQTILAGEFASGFSIPPAGLTNNEMLAVEIKCGEHKWHFSDVGPRALRQGWWWVGTDFPPFQETFQEDDRFKDAVWIKYLTVDPIGDEPFHVYKFCPARLKDQKPGPCYTD
jgi:hypothetical protein